MTFKTTKLRDAITFALAVGVIAGTGSAFAQDPAPPATETTDLDRIEVTGSRIRQVDVETSAPVLLIDRQDIERQGFNTVADILENVSAVGSPAISRTSPLSSGEAVGGTYIDLRNLGPNRTLILLNGKRLGIDNNGLQDVSLIPAAMIERVEILKDGASTIYGSDAIAGVINLITRKNFDGAEASAYVGQFNKGDGHVQNYDFVIGFTGERGSVTAGVEYHQEDPVWAKDRWFSADSFPRGEKKSPYVGGRSGTSQWGHFVYDGVQYTLDRDTAGLDPRNFGNFRPKTAADAARTNDQSTVYTGLDRRSIFLNARYDITDSISFESDLLYSDRESFAQNAGYPYQSAAFGTPLDIDSYFNPLGNQSTGLPPGATPATINYVRRGWEVPRGVNNSITTYRFTGAFTGSFDLADKPWDWDAGYLYNQNKGVQVSTGNLNTQAVALATGPSFLNSQGIVQCGTPDNPIPLGFGGGTCTPWNPLVPFGYNSPNSLGDPNVQAFLYLPGQALSEVTSRNYFANVSGSLATLPAGDLGMAVGVEHRKEEGFFSPDALAQTGVSTDLAAGPTAGGYSLDEVYAELSIPVLADVPGAQELSFSAATRYSDYDTFGDTLNSKFGFKWKPIESLLIRGTWAEGFRAPDIASLFGGSSQTFSSYSDPCDTLYGTSAGSPRCLQDVPANFRQAANTASGFSESAAGAQTPIPFQSGSNPELQPETSESKTLGLVWSPGFAEGLNLSLDWWNIRIESTIIGDTEDNVLTDCYVRLIESRCNAATGSRFTRDPVTGQMTFFATGPVNVGYVETEGYDFDVNYKLDTDWGRFTGAWMTTYVSRLEQKTDALEDTPPSQLNGFGGNFRVRSNLNLGWDKGDFGASWGMRYYSGVKATCFDSEDLDNCSIPDYTAPDLNGNIFPQNELGSTIFHDVQARVNAPWNATVSVGVNNIFNRYGSPNYDNPNSGYAYYGGFDIGRFVYFKYTQKF